MSISLQFPFFFSFCLFICLLHLTEIASSTLVQLEALPGYAALTKPSRPSATSHPPGLDMKLVPMGWTRNLTGLSQCTTSLLTGQWDRPGRLEWVINSGPERVSTCRHSPQQPPRAGQEWRSSFPPSLRNEGNFVCVHAGWGQPASNLDVALELILKSGRKSWNDVIPAPWNDTWALQMGRRLGTTSGLSTFRNLTQRVCAH